MSSERKSVRQVGRLIHDALAAHLNWRAGGRAGWEGYRAEIATEATEVVKIALDRGDQGFDVTIRRRPTAAADPSTYERLRAVAEGAGAFVGAELEERLAELAEWIDAAAAEEREHDALTYADEEHLKDMAREDARQHHRCGDPYCTVGNLAYDAAYTEEREQLKEGDDGP